MTRIRLFILLKGCGNKKYFQPSEVFSTNTEDSSSMLQYRVIKIVRLLFTIQHRSVQ